MIEQFNNMKIQLCFTVHSKASYIAYLEQEKCKSKVKINKNTTIYKAAQGAFLHTLLQIPMLTKCLNKKFYFFRKSVVIMMFD